MRLTHRGLIFGIVFLLFGGKSQTQQLRAAAGKVDITPQTAAFLAGYGKNRISTGAHDRLMARCLVLESGGTRIAIVSCDLIGLPRYRVQEIRARVHSVKPENLYIAATHTHSGPDTLGQWGPDLHTSGVDKAWMQDFETRTAALIDAAAQYLQPAKIAFAHTMDAPKISKNIRVPRILDTELAVMQAVGAADGKPIATLVNFACHPEIMNTRQMTADFPHWLYETVEAKEGGVCLYLNGAQGGMITADFDETTTAKGENWKAAETIGNALGAKVLELAASAEPAAEVPIHTQRSVFKVPMENAQFKALMLLKVFPRDLAVNGEIETEVNRITIGNAEFLTLPGEVLPNIGLYLKRQMHGEPKFLLGLTCDELGYILTPEDYGLNLYSYETQVSVGSQVGALMERSLEKLMTAK